MARTAEDVLIVSAIETAYAIATVRPMPPMSVFVAAVIPTPWRGGNRATLMKKRTSLSASSAGSRFRRHSFRERRMLSAGRGSWHPHLNRWIVPRNKTRHLDQAPRRHGRDRHDLPSAILVIFSREDIASLRNARPVMALQETDMAASPKLSVASGLQEKSKALSSPSIRFFQVQAILVDLAVSKAACPNTHELR